VYTIVRSSHLLIGHLLDIPASRTQTFAEYFKAYRTYHKLLNRKESSISRIRLCNNKEPCVEVGSASLKFHRTLRIPDDAEEYFLPPVRKPVRMLILFPQCQ
jgi:hypothetical protein